MLVNLLFARSASVETNGIFKRLFDDKIVVIDASGSSKQHINGSKQMTKPEYAIYPYDKQYDWCSNCGKTYDEHPWITFSLKDKKFKINGYFIRCGCCYHDCCCEDYGYCIDCCLYSWSMQISEDNKTWTEVHKVERDDSMRRCNEKTYKFNKDYTTKYIRIIQNEPCPGWPPCMSINKMEIFGEILNDNNSNDYESFQDDDEDVSIIGHISKNGDVKFN